VEQQALLSLGQAEGGPRWPWCLVLLFFGGLTTTGGQGLSIVHAGHRLATAAPAMHGFAA